MIDPLVWMQAACIAAKDEGVGELSMEWERPMVVAAGGEVHSERLQIIVRREVTPIVVQRRDDGSIEVDPEEGG